jgi:hypothetical protein
MEFIETIQEFTLGEWREIVVLSQAAEEIPTKKAWELFQEAYRRYKNRLAALSYMEARNKKMLQDAETKVNPEFSGKSQQLTSLEKSFGSQGTKVPEKELKPSAANSLVSLKVGKAELGKKYRLQWTKALNSVKKHSPLAAEFLSKSSGIFNVEESRFTINVTVEVLDEGLKLFRSQIKQPVLNECFSLGFDKPVKVMFRVSLAQMNSRH